MLFVLPLVVLAWVKIFGKVNGGYVFIAKHAGVSFHGNKKIAYSAVNLFCNIIDRIVFKLKVGKLFKVFALKIGFIKPGNIPRFIIAFVNNFAVFVRIGILSFLGSVPFVYKNINSVRSFCRIAHISLFKVEIKRVIGRNVNIFRHTVIVVALILIAAREKRNHRNRGKNKGCEFKFRFHFPFPPYAVCIKGRL